MPFLATSCYPVIVESRHSWQQENFINTKVERTSMYSAYTYIRRITENLYGNSFQILLHWILPEGPRLMPFMKDCFKGVTPTIWNKVEISAKRRQKLQGTTLNFRITNDQTTFVQKIGLRYLFKAIDFRNFVECSKFWRF
jgi:hypothetical protein